LYKLTGHPHLKPVEDIDFKDDKDLKTYMEQNYIPSYMNEKLKKYAERAKQMEMKIEPQKISR